MSLLTDGKQACALCALPSSPLRTSDHVSSIVPFRVVSLHLIKLRHKHVVLLSERRKEARRDPVFLFMITGNSSTLEFVKTDSCTEIGVSGAGAGSKNMPQVSRLRSLWKNHLEKGGSVSPAI